MPSNSGGVDEDDLAVRHHCHLEPFDIANGRAVAIADAQPVDFHLAGRRNQIAEPTLARPAAPVTDPALNLALKMS